MSQTNRIMVVDDEELNCLLMESFLELLGYETVIARSGEEALSLLDDSIDLILLDVMMPGMTGFDVVSRIRQHPKYSDIPVIMATALSGQRDRLAAVEAGANDFITKPIEETELRVRTASALKMKHAQDTAKNYRRDLEQQVEERTSTLRDAMELLEIHARELTRSNAELDQFAYVASHDLQEPLRTITSYIQLLARRYKGELDSDADEFIQYTVEGAARMQTLIRGLLEYSRVGRRASELTEVDCSTVLQNAIANLSVAINESNAVITHDLMPVVMGDALQLGQLFQNLLSNALKFRGEAAPSIHVGVRKFNDRWEFSFRDNGIGIDPRHAERVFQVFQRLHKQGEYEGTGIGLAVCKKIVDKHGGVIRVESDGEGAGSIFLFTLASILPKPGESYPVHPDSILQKHGLTV